MFSNLTILFVLIGSSSAHNICNYNYNYCNKILNVCLFSNKTETSNKTEAQGLCAENGSILLEIYDDMYQRFVEDALNMWGGFEEGKTWLNLEGDNNTFIWSTSGTLVTYTKLKEHGDFIDSKFVLLYDNSSWGWQAVIGGSNLVVCMTSLTSQSTSNDAIYENNSVTMETDFNESQTLMSPCDFTSISGSWQMFVTTQPSSNKSTSINSTSSDINGGFEVDDDDDDEEFYIDEISKDVLIELGLILGVLLLLAIVFAILFYQQWKRRQTRMNGGNDIYSSRDERSMIGGAVEVNERITCNALNWVSVDNKETPSIALQDTPTKSFA